MSTVADRFTAIARSPDEEIDVAEAVAWIAKEEYPDLDVEACLGQIDELAAGARARIAGAGNVSEQIERFNQFLFVEQRFRGNTEGYGDPRNSYLNDVLERRTGIPISLSVVYVEIARRLGLRMAGVGFPGHFLVRHLDDPRVIVDPFGGRVITERECEERLRAHHGPEARLDPRMLEPARPRDILLRWLRNLKQNYLATRDWARALRAVEHMLRLAPEDARELRDRGILYAQLECFAAALADFRRYLELAPGDEAAAAVRARLPELERRVGQLH